ncbi:hypothetical protein F7725_005782 [Dissostichus mawsoni]|uniref:CCHC NOA-type domain-containing protein n=1 Tax=Dissostichus mawsoni TaxID=36200 RepID=A0A7J5YVA2_DISMA|nr:hypothetical protein F7725_005782 [Dissostichus mawsoni]
MDNVSMNSDLRRENVRSCSMLNTLYHETRQETDLLNKQLYVKDNIIADLKTRLGKYERIYVTVGDNQSVVIEPSKSLLESLCKEICKLKQKKNDMEFKATRQTEEIQRLNALLREKDLELEGVRGQPDHEKDQEIHRLHLALEERERSEATRAVLCTSLAEEADQMRSHLGATVKVCQEMLARLERDTKNGGEVEIVAEQHKTKEVQSLNTQWQKYDSSREDYIRGLCQRLKETPRQGLMPGLGSISTELLHQEISRLNGLLEEKMNEGVEETKRQDKVRIQTLEQQTLTVRILGFYEEKRLKVIFPNKVLIYEEDFKSERADRERAHGKIQDLKEQVHQLKQQLHKQGASRDNREVVPMCRVHIGHRITSRQHKDSSEPLLRNPAETQQQPVAPAAAPPPAWDETPALSELQCPHCLRLYRDTDAREYLNHCEECAKL